MIKFKPRFQRSLDIEILELRQLTAVNVLGSPTAGLELAQSSLSSYSRQAESMSPLSLIESDLAIEMNAIVERSKRTYEPNRDMAAFQTSVPSLRDILPIGKRTAAVGF